MKYAGRYILAIGVLCVGYGGAWGYLPSLADDFESYQLSGPGLEDQSDFVNLEPAYTCDVITDWRDPSNQIIRIEGRDGHWRFLNTTEDALGNMIGNVRVEVDFCVSTGYLNFYVWETYDSSAHRPLHAYFHANGNIGLFIQGGWRHYTGVIVAGQWYRFKGLIHFEPDGTSNIDFQVIRSDDGVTVASDSGVDCLGSVVEARSAQLSLAPGYLAYIDNLFAGPTCSGVIEQQAGKSADLNGDCVVDLLDLAVLGESWLDCSQPTPLDCP